MTHHLSSSRWKILLLMLMPLLVSSACSKVTPDTTADSRTDLVFGPGDFIFTDTKAGLSVLSSYKATLTYSFDGTRAGNTEQWSKTYVMLTAREPAARQLTIDTVGNIPDLDAVFMAELDGAAYERRGENACTASVIEQGNSLADWLEPAGFLTSVIGADEAGGETVNGMAADRYTFDERALGGLGIVESGGEMWVASEGGYIVKYLVTTEGNADYFGEGIEGTLTWDYELTDINGPVTIELPADCPAGMVDAPLLPDASDVLNMPSILNYDSSTSLAEAAAFHQEQIPNLGWALIREPAITETNALMEFTQGDQNLTVIITSDAGVTTVNILLEKAQE